MPCAKECRLQIYTFRQHVSAALLKITLNKLQTHYMKLVVYFIDQRDSELTPGHVLQRLHRSAQGVMEAGIGP